MKNYFKKLVFSGLMLFLIVGISLAQNKHYCFGNFIMNKHFCFWDSEMEDILTEEQKIMYEEIKLAREKRREAFKASLTATQLEILENNELTKEEKKETFRASLSEDKKILCVY